MLKKLFKYDLKYMLKEMWIFYILTIVFALFVRGSSLFKQTIIVVIIKSLCESGLVALIVNIFINSMFRFWRRFNHFLYKDEGYLTNTLPVTRKSIYLSTFITTFVIMLINILIIFISLFVAYFNTDIYIGLINSLNALGSNWVVILTILILFIEFLNYILFGYFGLIVGNTFNTKRTGKSVLFGFVAYAGSQVIAMFALGCGVLFNSNFKQIFTSSEITDLSFMNELLIVCLIGCLLTTLIVSFLSCKFLKKGINIE